MGAITLDRLVFDTANTADSANVGAYLRASDGSLISHTSNSLNVNLTNASIVVTATNLDTRDLVFATDKVDASGSEVSLDSATLAALESITVQNGAGASAVNVQDGGNSITVDAVNLDVRDLTHVSDSVKIGDGTDFLAVNGDGSINVAQASGTSASYGNATVTTTATKIIATNLSGRRAAVIQNRGSKSIFIGHDSSITAANCPELPAGSSVEMPFGSTLDVYGITATGSSDIRYNEVA